MSAHLCRFEILSLMSVESRKACFTSRWTDSLKQSGLPINSNTCIEATVATAELKLEGYVHFPATAQLKNCVKCLHKCCLPKPCDVVGIHFEVERSAIWIALQCLPTEQVC